MTPPRTLGLPWRRCPPSAGPPPRPRVLTGRIYAIGGFGVSGHSNAVEVYDPTKPAEGWKAVAPMPAPRSSLAAVTGPDGRIYVMGGEGGGQPARTTVEAYTPGAPGTPGSWASVAPMDTARSALGAATGSDGLIYAVGGRNSSANGGLNTAEAYTPGAPGTPGSWEPVASMNTARSDLAATASSR